MRLGLLPSQQRALRKTMKKARKFDDFRARTRRHFLALGIVAGSASVASFFVGRGTSSEPAADSALPLPLLRQAHRLTVGSIDELLADYATLLLALERRPNDPVLTAGFARLVDGAVERADRELARHLARSARRLPAPLSRFHVVLDAVADGK